MKDAIEIALKNNRQILAAEWQSRAAERSVGQAKGAFLPRIDLVEGFSYTDKPTMVFSSLLDQASFKQRNFAVSSLNEPTPLTNLSSQVRVEQPLYTGGKLSADLRQAEAGAQASQEQSRRTRQEVIFRVTEAYYHARLSEGNLIVVEKALDSARAHLERARNLFEKGLAIRADYLRTEVLVGSLEREKIEAENRVRVGHARLRHLVGSVEERWTLTGQIVEDGLPVEELPLLVAEAKELRPDLKAAGQEVEKTSAAVRSAAAGYHPSLGFVTQFEGNTRRFTSSGENFAVFVTARWNLFSGFITQEKIAQEEAFHQRARLLRDDLLQAIHVEVEQALLGLLAARRQVGVAKENVAQAEESLRILKDRYEVGLARNIDVLDAEVTVKKAEQDLLQARVNSRLFRAMLNLATGTLQ
ncbi:MAG: TolC family protein [Deltaproteobacteria bacterium]|nr:TolC family protein [Deltaproteobacteria bacterium]